MSHQADCVIPPVAQPAIDAVLAAFRTHPLVGVGDHHGLAQQSSFYTRLVCDPRFARDVGNVVVEFGGAASQSIVDRYVAGETVQYEELRTVWTDVVGWVPTVLDLGLIRFFAAVRATNMQLARDQHIRVWLGEPAIDWTRIKTREDFHALLASRDTHAAKIVIDEILSKGKRALVIYGTGHFQRGFAGQSLLDLIEIDFPGSLFLIVPYIGFGDAACTIAFEAQFDNWPTPALVSPIKGTTLEDVLRLPDFRVLDLGATDGMQEPTEAQLAQLARLESVVAGLTADALLYLGPAATLITSPIDPSIYLDLDFLKEISRRSELQIGKPISLSDAVNMATTIPRQIRHLPLSLAVSSK